MSANQEKDEGVVGGSDDDFQYEEVPLGDDCSLTELEEDLEATLKAIQDRAEASDTYPRPNASTTRRTQAVDAFMRHFLLQMSMTETLDCFQAEWDEMAQKGPVVTGQSGVLPDVYAENQRLHSELKDARREGEEHRLAASAVAGTLARVQKDRDLHRMQHNRVVQEKNAVIEEIRKLTVRCSRYEAALKRATEKYQAGSRQTMLATSKRDKTLAGLPVTSRDGDARGEDTVRYRI
ncbi:sperm-associated antigen 16 protein-like isoform 1-T1 [Spinachia spinachia]